MNKFTYEERAKVYEATASAYGTEAQTIVAIEELSELAKEVCKWLRGNQNYDHMAEEIADVTIMLEQLRLMFGLNDEVCNYMDSKIERLKGRIGMNEKVDSH